MKTLFATCVVLGLAVLLASSVFAQYPEVYYEVTGPASGTVREIDNPNVVLTVRFDEVAGYDSEISYWYIENYGGSLDYDDWDYWTLWLDENGDGQLNGSDYDIYYSNDSPNYMYFYPGIYIPAGESVHLIITVTLQSSANPGNNIELYFADDWIEVYSYYGYWGYAKETNGQGAGYGPTMTIIPSTSNLALAAGAQVPTGNAIRGSINHPVCQFRLTQDNTGLPPEITAVRVHGDTGHTALPADITAIRLYREGPIPNGVLDGTDTLVAAGSPITGTFSYQFGGLISVPTSGVTLLVVADISGNATVDRIFRLYTQRSDLVTQSQWSGGVLKVTEDAQTIKNPLATYLEIAAQPGNTPAGVWINNPAGIRVEALQPDTTLDTAYGSPVSVLIESGPGIFSTNSTTTVLASGGVATFTNLAITKAGTYSLRFVSPPLSYAITVTFEITPLAANKLYIVTQPQHGVVGAALPPPPVVEAWDQYNNLAVTFNGDITAALQSNPGNSTLTGEQATAVNGVATFPNLQFNRVGSGYTLYFVASGLIDSQVSDTFNISVGAPSQLVFLQQPGSTTGGVTITPWPRVQVQDVGGNPIAGYIGDMAVSIGNNPSGGTLSGTNPVAVVSSVAEFNNLSLNTAGNAYTLVFSIEAGTVSAESAAFNVVVGPPVKLGIVQQPVDSTGGLPFSSQPVLQAQDAGGNLVASDNLSTVTAAITTGTGESGALLYGTKTINVSAGVATFSNLAVDKAGPLAYTLTFTSSAGYAQAESASFVISVGPAAKLGVTTQPGLASFAVPFIQQPVVQVQDAGANHVVSATDFITVVIAPATGTTGATLQGTTGFVAVGGVVTFVDLTIDFAGVNFVLRFSAPGLLDADSAAFNVASPATHLGVALEPSTGSVGVILSVQPIVQVRDVAGTVVSVDNFTLVTAEIVSSTGTPGAFLSGTTTVYSIQGSAQFTNLKIDTPGVGYRLKFTSYPSLSAAYSAAFDVAGTPVKLKVARSPGGADAGEPFATQPRVEVLDANDVVCIGESSVVVTAYITPATGSSHAILGGTKSVYAIGGVAEFSGLFVDRPGQGYSLSFSSTPSLHPASTLEFDVVGEAKLPGSSDKDFVAGSDGGACSASHDGAAAWLLLLVVALAKLMRLRRQEQR